MKPLLVLALLTIIAFAQAPADRIVILPIQEAPKEAPLFFSATAEVDARASLSEITARHRLVYQIHQGKPETLTLGLGGAGEVVSVTGENLRDWSVRVAEDGSRFLDVRPTDPGTTSLLLDMQTRIDLEKYKASLLLPTPGPATGFSLSVRIAVDPGIDLRVTNAAGLAPVSAKDFQQFIGTGAATLDLEVSPGGSGSRGMELFDVGLFGRKSPDSHHLSFRLTAMARARAPGSALELLGGGAALSGAVSGDGWHVALREKDGAFVHDLIADREGEFPISLEIEVPVRRKGDWSEIQFRLPAGVVVPLWIEGLGGDVSFNRELAVVPELEGATWRGFLPASGTASLAWRTAGAVADGDLFFSSTETSDVRVGSGLLRQMTAVDLRVLQGKLSELSLTLSGPGEVLSVSGEPVLGWSVRQDGDVRRLEVKLSRPIEGSGRILIEAQAALGGLPVRAEALRMAPTGTLRHSGWLRIANEGAVRIEVADARGLIQLTPGQFPGGIDETLRQVFVYRFPSADYGYAVRADQVLPEIGVTEVTVYEIAETDRRITSDLELDIREAPLREWEIEIPADHAVASVTGAEVADHVVASEVRDGKRTLKILFKQAVANRQLISVRLEKNQSAAAGAWELPPLGFPGAKSRRGYIGAVAAAGFRLVAGTTVGVAEVPVTFFPKKTTGLQQSFRLREAAWQVGLTIEALGQSVQADVFHLYSLKSGAAYGSVLINYFVVGAPATVWRIAVPAGIGNIDVTGQNVGRDWRREDNVVIVPLSRPILGTGTVLLTFEQPMGARGGDLTPGEVRPLDVQGERGYVQVVSPLQVKFGKPGSEGPLLAIDPSELPAEFRLLSSAPTLAAWQYTARDFKIDMKIEWFEPGETVGQVVDFLKLSSQVSRDGQWVTNARFFVKSRGRNALRMVLPDQVSLWEATVDGEAVNARSDGGETLIPLPLRADPNQAVEVALRYGARSEIASRPRLVAPKLAAPVVIGEWTVSGDKGRQLVPRGGTAELVNPALAESGWEWLGRHAAGAVSLLVLGCAALVFGRFSVRGTAGILAMMAAIGFIAVAMVLGFSSAANSRDNAAMLEYSAPVVAAGSEVAVEVANVAPWVARTGVGVWLLFGLGTASAAHGGWIKSRLWTGIGLALMLAAIFSIRGGAALAFAVTALVGVAWILPRFQQALHDARRPKLAEATVACMLLAGFAFSEVRAAETSGLKPAESMVHDWLIRDGRLHGNVEITLRGEAGDRFLLLQPPVVLSGFEGAGLQLVKTPLDGGEAYVLVASVSGRLTGKATFQMPLADPGKGWILPGGPAAMRQVTVQWDQSGWEFFSEAAARTEPLTKIEDGSGAVMVFGPVNPATIQARPKQRDLGAEEIRYFSEVSNLFIPGPGVVNGRHRLSIRPAQGRVSSLVMSVPEGFTVSEVMAGPVGTWRFDPAKRELRVAVEPAQAEPFGLTIETQRGEGGLPMELTLDPIRVIGAAGEVGFLALAFGEDAQQESIEVEGLSRVNPGDFDRTLVPRDKDGNPLVLLQNAFRYGAGDVEARVKVAAVAPELRAESWQLVSLGEDRLLMALDLNVTITRSGVFRLELEVPPGLEIESATGEGLSHWTDGTSGDVRILTLHLSGKTLGKRDFNLSFSGPPPGAQLNWSVPRLAMRDASRETGVVTIVPERGLQVRSVERRNVSQLDPRELAEAPKDSARAASRPGALAYRLLQGDWALALAIDRLDPWVTAQVFHEAILREGQMLTRAVIGYRIENAALKTLRVRIPGLNATAAATVRASGAAVADFVPVEGEDGLWEIRLQRGVAGETTVDIEYQRAGTGDGIETIEPIVLENVRKLTYFAAIRAGGRLELQAGVLPRGWQRADWAVVRSTLGHAAGSVAPLMTFSVADPEGPLPVNLKRHQLAELQKLRVSEGTLTTLMSPEGDALTAVDLKMQVTGKGTLRLKLPEKSALFNVLVNEQGATLVREGDEWLFHVFPSPDAGRPASVRFVYSGGTTKGERLEGPVLDVPMENLTWRVLVPEGWKMTRHGGDFDLIHHESLGSYRLEDYQSLVRSKRSSDSQSAAALLDQANLWMAGGEQEKAGIALGNAVRSNQLDAASGEDARVQLRQLKTQQAVLGLNTRRQKLLLDNSVSSSPTDTSQLARAAEANPVLRGDSNYDPKQFDRFLEGNTADENSALKEIANRIVTQQLAAEPAPASLDVTLPERGTVLTFGRSVQVDGDRPMAIELKLKRQGVSHAWLGLLLCLTAGGLAGTALRNGPKGRDRSPQRS